MGRKRKRGQQSKHDWGIPTSRQQKKIQKVRGKGFNRSTKAEKGAVAINSIIVENFSRETSISSCEVSPCRMDNIPSYEGSKTAKFSRVNNIFARLKSVASIFQRSTLKRVSSIRKVFLLLDWLRQIFGCGLQALGKILLFRENMRITHGGNNSEAIIMKRLTDLEGEVAFLKSELAKIKMTRCPCGNDAAVCTKDGYNLESSSSNLMVPPPPPPPPPPPVLPPPAPPLAFLKGKQQSVSKSVESMEPTKKPISALVTLEDLKKVKLRKVPPDEERLKNKENIKSNSETDISSFKMQHHKSALGKISQRKDLPQCIISLREIKDVTLRQTKSESDIDKIKLRTPEEMIITRSKLRKVNITRSPGGTPLVSNRNKENGTGLTPMITKALQRKFQRAHPYSCSPELSLEAKGRQSLSPMVSYSPNTPSPLLLNNNYNNFNFNSLEKPSEKCNF